MSETTTTYGVDGEVVDLESFGYRAVLRITDANARPFALALAEFAGLAINDTPAPFKENAAFEDIRKGDLVRVEYVEDDLSIVFEGVAHAENVFGSDWKTETGNYLCLDVAHNNGGTVTIISRSEPAWKDGDLVLDADGDAWLFDGDRWSEVAGSCVYTTVKLEGHYGPVTRAKVVAADD